MSGPVEAWAVVLAGGIGSRFWPASTPSRPKQLLPLGEGGRPLLAEALERAERLVGAERVLVVAGEHLLEPFARAIPELDRDRVLCEPAGRGTAPALAWAAHHVERAEPGAVMVATHADHVIGPPEAFQRTLRRAVEVARDGGRLYCVAAVPDRPETGYGYLLLGERIGPGIHAVERFVEKPDRPTAERYLASGRARWNTGIFVWRVDEFLEAIRAHTPEVADALPELDRNDVEAYFEAVTPVSVDVGVMERAPSVGAVQAEFRWDDVGVWPALARTRTGDEAGNVAVGEVRAVECHRTIAWAEDGPVTLFGVEDLVVVRSGGRVLVTTREHAHRLKELLERLAEP